MADIDRICKLINLRDRVNAKIEACAHQCAEDPNQVHIFKFNEFHALAVASGSIVEYKMNCPNAYDRYSFEYNGIRFLCMVPTNVQV